MRHHLAMAVFSLGLAQMSAADCQSDMQRSDRILDCHVYDMSCENMQCQYIGNCGEQFDQSGCVAALRYLADGLGPYFCDSKDKFNISADKQDVVAKICGKANDSPPSSVRQAPSAVPTKTLTEAAKDGDIASLRRSLSAGTEIDALDPDGYTPLMVASMWGQVDAMGVLIDAGADIAGQSEKYGFTALMLAAREGRVGAIDTLLRAGASVESRSAENWGHYTAAFIAAAAGQVGALKALVNAGANVNVTDVSKNTPLIRATENADVAMVQALVAAGADVNARDRNGYSVLQYVPIRGGDTRKNAQVRAILVKAGARK